MLDRRAAHPHHETIDPDEVRQERVREEERQHEVHRVLREPPRMQLSPRVLAVELHRTAPAALEQALDRPENEFHVHRLRTGPPAPDAPGERRHQEDSDEDAEHEQHQQQRVGREERRAENREPAKRQVEQDERHPVPAQVRDDEEDHHQRVRDGTPAHPELSGRQLRTDPPAGSVLVHRRENAADRDRRRHFSRGTSTPCGGFGFGGFEPCSVNTYAATSVT